MQIRYGIKNNNIDVTQICLEKLFINNCITIPSGDNVRSQYFSDPLPGVLKYVFIVNNNSIDEFDYTKFVHIDTVSNTINIYSVEINWLCLNVDKCDREKIESIHNKLDIKYGSFNGEIPEQIMAVKYIKGHEKVLEIGGNIGRNSLLISYILREAQNTQMVVLESDEDISKQLKENRDMNNMAFHIENFALSKRNLIQKDEER